MTLYRHSVAQLIVEAAKTLILPRFRQLGADDIQTKSSPTDLVTIADTQTELWLTPRLQDLLPGSEVLGEEAVSQGMASAQILEGSAPVWVIDPVDGTYNFAHGDENFCTMIALIRETQVQEAWIYFPTEERMFWAAKGQGTHVQFADETSAKLKIEDPDPTGALSHKFWKRPELKAQKSQILEQLAPTTRTRCAGRDYASAVTGKISFAAMATLTPWDHAPGTLMVQEAGGEVWLDRGAYDPRVKEGTLIFGGNRARMSLAADLLDPTEP